MNARELRRKYIEFFKSKDHREYPSSSLVPINVLGNEDESLLFTSAGMVQFKPYFLAVAQPPHPRLTDAQKCLRTTDIESVGDSSHLTFFEMMGNFSFGNYFKPEAIEWAWEFLTEWLKLDPSRLRVTVYKEDDEAYNLWLTKIGLHAERISRFDEDKNYWPGKAVTMGPNGPCGPCSEIFWDTSPDLPFDNEWNGDGNRWLEIWNLVFMQFERIGDLIIDNALTRDGHWENVELLPLPNKNVDTGMGLERTSAALLGMPSVYETDVFQPILKRIGELSKRNYETADEPIKVVFRIIADHIRSATFCIADGVRPENTGRGYVLRRLIRRAILKGQRQLGFKKPFFADVFPAVVEVLSDQYPELIERRDFIIRTLQDEEDLFRSRLAEGIKRAEGLALTGRDAFMLYDTYGFPLEVTMELAQERGLTIDLEEFNRSLEEQRQRSKVAGGIAEDVFSKDAGVLQELTKTIPATQFAGYSGCEAEAQVVGLIVEGKIAQSAKKGDRVEVILDQTPFYAESGGPVGDTGKITSPTGSIEVLDTQKVNERWAHIGKVLEGEISVGEQVHAVVETARRMDIERNHTATHLLHAALRTVLGAHVHQAGSLVAPNSLRFDFTHNKAMTEDEIRGVEELVNHEILSDRVVQAHADMPIAEARERGAMALFGEKYGDKVRMVEVEQFSRELCGGLHVGHTSQIGQFRITTESSVASGVRRIEAVTGIGAYQYGVERDRLLREAAATLRTSPNEIAAGIERLQNQLKQTEKRLEGLRTEQASTGAEVKVFEVDGIKIVAQKAENTDAKSASIIADRLAEQNPDSAVIIAAIDEGKAMFVAKVPALLLQKGVHAGNLVREVAKIAGGGGGGRPDFAQAGAKDLSKIDEALLAVPGIIEGQLKSK
ncbi:MAG: alanine--tRNA ligase [bacterium]